ncbi:MAG: type II toxin-antitoxin system RelE/ParE family toxin [Moraxellaceae bacterium]
MAEIIWAEPALEELEAVAGFIARDNPLAAAALVERVFAHIEQLLLHPESGSRLKERGCSRYRQIVEPPCRVIYRCGNDQVVIVAVIREEQRLRSVRLAGRDGLQQKKKK